MGEETTLTAQGYHMPPLLAQSAQKQLTAVIVYVEYVVSSTSLHSTVCTLTLHLMTLLCIYVRTMRWPEPMLITRSCLIPPLPLQSAQKQLTEII